MSLAVRALRRCGGPAEVVRSLDSVSRTRARRTEQLPCRHGSRQRRMRKSSPPALSWSIQRGDRAECRGGLLCTAVATARWLRVAVSCSATIQGRLVRSASAAARGPDAVSSPRVLTTGRPACDRRGACAGLRAVYRTVLGARSPRSVSSAHGARLPRGPHRRSLRGRSRPGAAACEDPAHARCTHVAAPVWSMNTPGASALRSSGARDGVRRGAGGRRRRPGSARRRRPVRRAASARGSTPPRSNVPTSRATHPGRSVDDGSWRS